MGDVFKQRWKRRDGSSGLSRKWYGEFRDETDKLRRVPLSSDKQAARAMLSEHVRRAERRRAGLIDEPTAAAGEPLAPLVDEYLADRSLAGSSPEWRKQLKGVLGRTLAGAGWATPAQIRAESLEAWLAALDRSAKTKQIYRQAAIGLARWLVKRRKLASNPLLETTRPEGPATRKRRALTIEELRSLVAAAADRPLRDAETIQRGARKGQRAATVKDHVRERLVREGRARALLYRLAFYTGLRAKELRALRVVDLVLDGPHPRLYLPGAETKNDDDAHLPLPMRLAADLSAWVAERGLAPGDRVLTVPGKTAAVLRKDLAAAGVPYRDARGRVADFHALRGSLSSHLNARGVAATTVKALMRHSSVELSLGTYHDPAMDDKRGAVEGLPEV